MPDSADVFAPAGLRSPSHYLPHEAPVAVHRLAHYLPRMFPSLPALFEEPRSFTPSEQLAYPVYSFLLPVYSFWRFDDFSWGNTRVVIGEGRSKKVLQAEDEAFDESTIPLAKFSEYEAIINDQEYLDSRSEKESTAGFSLATRLPQGAYQGGPDFYRDTVHTRQGSRSTMGQFNLPQLPSQSQGFGGFGGGPGSMIGMPSQMGYGYPGGPGSMVGSEFGYPQASNPQFMPTLASQMSVHNMNLGGAPSLSALPRRQSGMSGFSGYNGGAMAPSVYSMNPFANPPAPTPSQDPNPSDELLHQTLVSYLAGQDCTHCLSLLRSNPTAYLSFLLFLAVMKLSKRQARDALQGLFPQADLASKKDLINSYIDQILSGQ